MRPTLDKAVCCCASKRAANQDGLENGENGDGLRQSGAQHKGSSAENQLSPSGHAWHTDLPWK